MNQRDRILSVLIAGAVPALVAQPAFAQGTAITGVQLQQTDSGIELILESPTGKQPETFRTTYGETLIIDLINTQLQGEGFLEENPAPGIASVEVVQQYTNTVRVKLVGTEEVPTAQVNTTGQSLALNITTGMNTAEEPATEPEVTAPPEEPETAPPTAEDEEPIELVVTAEQQEGYRVDDVTTGTRTDTPLRDIPQSIQVVPEQVIEDQQATDLQEVTRNVSGIFQGNTFGSSLDRFLIRGFQTDVFLQDGFRDPISSVRGTANIERVEVLKGPASVLYGTLEPGGIINLVTKKPLEDPLYSAELTVGSFNTVETSIDLGGPLNEDETLLYRFNALYENRDVFRDFEQGVEEIFAAPSLTWKIGDNTDITFNFEYINEERPFDRGIVAIGDSIADIPFDRVLGEPDDVVETESFGIGYQLEHRFSDNWKLRNKFRFDYSDRLVLFTRSRELNEETGILMRQQDDRTTEFKTYALQTNIVGEFATGTINHTLLFGVDLFRENQSFDVGFTETGGIPDRDIFNPENDVAPRPERDEFPNQFASDDQTDTLGIYLQDQIELSEQWQLLAGGRFDIVDQESDSEFNGEISSSQQQEEAFSPRFGLVYQPSETLSLYSSFSQSFVPNTSTNAEGELLEPERGTQYEVGIKSEFLDGRMSATLAAFNITKSNIAVADPNLANVSRPIGEQRSRGIELDVRGEISPGWNIIASYAYTDAEITEDDGSEIEGNRVFGVPKHAANLWTTYEIQEGDLQGLGFGAGIFFVGEREGDRDNNFDVPSYTRTDASIFYRRDNWRAAINFKNLFDIDYIESTNGFNRLGVNPGIPFTVLGTIEYQF